MAGPARLADILAAVMIVTAGYCASRMVAARYLRRATEHDVDLAHTVMGVAMAGMLVPRLDPLAAVAWEAVFCAAMAWFGWRALRARAGHGTGGHRPVHHAPHFLACGAMLYMFLAASAARTGAARPTMLMSGSSAGAWHSPTLALLLAVALLGYVIWTTDRLTSLPTAAATAVGVRAPPMDGTTGSAAVTKPEPAEPGVGHGPVPSGPTAAETPGSAGPARGSPHRAPAPQMSPRLAAGCEIAMGITMGYMLIQML